MSPQDRLSGSDLAPDALRLGRRHAAIHGWHDLDADVFAAGWAAARAELPMEPAGELDPAPAAPTPLATWESLWCEACGNRYTIEVDRCSCGRPVQPVTVQIVPRP